MMSVRRAYSDVAFGQLRYQLHYRVAGDVRHPTLLLLHQSPSHSAMYEPLMAALCNRYHLLAPDTPGFGSSDPLPETSIAAWTAAMAQWLDGLGCRPDFIFGHHTGAAIAAQLEHDRPGARAMALSGPPLLDEALQQKLPTLAEPVEADADGDHLVNIWQRLRAKDEEAPLALTERELLSAIACGQAWQASYKAVVAQDFGGLLPKIGCPVLVFAGDRDSLYQCVEPTLKRLPRAEQGLLAGGEGAYICERQVELVASLLDDFFARQGSAGEQRQ